MKSYTTNILVKRHKDTNAESICIRKFRISDCFVISIHNFFWSASLFWQKCTLHFLAQFHHFFFFSRFCSSTSRRPFKHLLSTFYRPSTDAESTKRQNIVNNLYAILVFILSTHNPQLMSRPPPVPNTTTRLVEFFHQQKFEN